MYFNDKSNLELFDEPYIFDDNNLPFILDEKTTSSLINMIGNYNLNEITFMNISKTTSTKNATKTNKNDINFLIPINTKDNIDNNNKVYEKFDL